MFTEVATKRAAIYTRVSTDDQAENGYSLKDQEKKGRKYIEDNGWTLAAEPYIDDGISGTLRHRPALDRLLHDVAARNIDVVIVSKTDRLARNLLLYLQLEHHIKKHDCELVMIDQPGDTNVPTGRFNRNLMASFAEYERDLIVERTTVGRLQKALGGEHWTVPYGHTRLMQAPWSKANPDTAPVVERIFKAIASGVAACQIAIQLTTERVPAPKGGSIWYHTAIGKIVKNTHHYGLAQYCRTTNRTVDGKRITRPNDPKSIICHQLPYHIVDKSLWDAANERLSGNKATARRNNKHNDLLRGLVRCGVLRDNGQVCDLRMSPERDGEYRQYRCTHTLTTGATKHHNVNAQALEDAIWASLVQQLANPSLVTNQLDAAAATSKVEAKYAKREIARLQKDYEEKWIEMKNLLRRLAKGTSIPQADIEAEYHTLGKERNGILDRIADLEAERDDAKGQILPIENVRTACALLSTGIENLDLEQRQHIVRLVIERVVATADSATLYGVLPEVTAQTGKYATSSEDKDIRAIGPKTLIADTPL